MTTTTATRRAPVLIERSVPFVAEANGTENDGRNLVGHAAVFGEKTRINSWEGEFDESIRSGAFRKTFGERTPVIQFDHGRHPLVGSIPIASFEPGYPTEDATGAAVRARVLDNWLMQPVRDAIAAGTINGMSFRFEVVRDRWTDAKGVELSPAEIDSLLWNPGSRGPLQRELIELKVPELGPVVFPAYAGTDVSVRSKELADEIRKDPGLVREVRRMLATGYEWRESVSDKAWDGSSSNYDITQWKKACLVDTGEGADTTKGRYKVPCREADGTLSRQGCHAAAGAHGLQGVKGVSDAIMKGAAKKLVGYYRDSLKEEPPAAILTMAGMPAAKSADLGGVARALLFDLPDHRTRRIADVRLHFEGRALSEERSLTAPEQATLASLLAEIAAADAAIDPICDALCQADTALDDASRVISSMLGIENPDPGDDGDMPGSTGAMDPGSMPANDAPLAAPREAHPVSETRTNEDAPPATEAPVNPIEARRAYVRRTYVTSRLIGPITGLADNAPTQGQG